MKCFAIKVFLEPLLEACGARNFEIGSSKARLSFGKVNLNGL